MEITYILTSKKNSDALENFFSIVRGRNGFNNNPSVSDFNYMIGKMISMKILCNASTVTNCEPDDDEYLTQAVDSENTTTNEDELNDSLCDQVMHGS